MVSGAVAAAVGAGNAYARRIMKFMSRDSRPRRCAPRRRRRSMTPWNCTFPRAPAGPVTPTKGGDPWSGKPPWRRTFA